MFLFNLIFFFYCNNELCFFLFLRKKYVTVLYLSSFFFVLYKGGPLSQMLTMKIYSCKPGGKYFRSQRPTSNALFGMNLQQLCCVSFCN